MAASYDLILVRQLAESVSTCEFFRPVLKELGERGLASDDLLDLIKDELQEGHFKKTRPTEKHYAGTMSDYYSIWNKDCDCHMFLKFLIHKDPSGERLVITSFKKDDSYGP